MAPAPKVEAAVEGPLPAAVLDKYKAAATVANSVLEAIKAKAVAGANLLELCAEGDRLLEAGTAALYNKVKGLPKGIAFPTSLSVNSKLQNFSPVPSDEEGAATVLASNDLVKIALGAHIDGYAVIAAETIVVSPSGPITDVRASLLAAAHNAAEAAIRLVKVGGRNWDVTEGIKKVVAEYESAGVKGVEGIMSHQHEQNSIEAKKGIVAFPSEPQRRDGDNAFTFVEGEVYGLNILVTNGAAIPKVDEARTTIYQKTTATYMLKGKTARSVYSEVSKKAGSFPFTLRVLDEVSKARMGIKECVEHGLLKEYPVGATDMKTDLSAQIFLTFAVTKTGAVRLSAAPSYYSPERVQSPVEIKDEETKALLARPLKAKPVKKAKAAGEEAKAE
ncbi:hypothetical protein P7C70_g1994, partial [Phenoliferia sp. Uapishka_3]